MYFTCSHVLIFIYITLFLIKLKNGVLKVLEPFYKRTSTIKSNGPHEMWDFEKSPRPAEITNNERNSQKPVEAQKMRERSEQKQGLFRVCQLLKARSCMPFFG